MCDFQPGDVVVCVDDAPRHVPGFPLNPPLVVKGRLYTVDRWQPVQLKSGRDPIALGLVPAGVVLREPDTFVTAWNGEPMSYYPDRFRLVYRPDGSLIAELLAATKQDVEGAAAALVTA